MIIYISKESFTPFNILNVDLVSIKNNKRVDVLLSIKNNTNKAIRKNTKPPTNLGCFVYSNDTCPKQTFNTQGK